MSRTKVVMSPKKGVHVSEYVENFKGSFDLFCRPKNNSNREHFCSICGVFGHTDATCKQERITFNQSTVDELMDELKDTHFIQITQV